MFSLSPYRFIKLFYCFKIINCVLTSPKWSINFKLIIFINSICTASASRSGRRRRKTRKTRKTRHPPARSRPSRRGAPRLPGGRLRARYRSRPSSSLRGRDPMARSAATSRGFRPAAHA